MLKQQLGIKNQITTALFVREKQIPQCYALTFGAMRLEAKLNI